MTKLKRRTNLENEQREDIVFPDTKEIQDLGFSNVFFAYDELNGRWSLHLRYRHVVDCNDNNNNNSTSSAATISSTTTIKEERKQEEEEQPQQPPLHYEERKQIVVQGCDPFRYIPTDNAIRTEFERQQIGKLTVENFISHFWEMNLQQKQQAMIIKTTDGKADKKRQQREASTNITSAESREENTTTTSCGEPANSTPSLTTEARVTPSADLDPYIPDRDYGKFIFKTIKKTVKQEDLLGRILPYVGLTAYSYNPLCIGIRAPTSEGKTYAVIESILKIFPKQDVMVIGSISPKALIREHGIIVDSNNEPLEGRIKELRRAIRESEDNEAREKLEEKLDRLYNEAKYLIDLGS